MVSYAVGPFLSHRWKEKIYLCDLSGCQCITLSAIVQKRDENGRVTDIQFLTHDVTDQRERELQQEDALRIALASAEHANKAKKFTPVGGMVNIRVSEKPCNRKGFTIFEFRVRDNGIGMSEEFQAHVFDSFSRERFSTQSGIKGTGLGMAITKNIVDMMGGTISLTSKESPDKAYGYTRRAIAPNRNRESLFW